MHSRWLYFLVEIGKGKGPHLFDCLLADDMASLLRSHKAVAAVHGQASQRTGKVHIIIRVEIPSRCTIVPACFLRKRQIKVQLSGQHCRQQTSHQHYHIGDQPPPPTTTKQALQEGKRPPPHTRHFHDQTLRKSLKALTLLGLRSSLRSSRCRKLVMWAIEGGSDFATRPVTTAPLLYRFPSSSAHTGGCKRSPDSRHVVHFASFSSSGFACSMDQSSSKKEHHDMKDSQSTEVCTNDII